MAVCGFCKKKVDLQMGTRKKKASENAVTHENAGTLVMYSCPHCESVLGFAY